MTENQSKEMQTNNSEIITSNQLLIPKKSNINSNKRRATRNEIKLLSKKINAERLDASDLKSKTACHLCEEKLGTPKNLSTPYNLRRHLLFKHHIEIINYKKENSKGGRPFQGGKKASRRRSYLKKTAGKIKPKNDLQKRKHAEYLRRAIKCDLKKALDKYLKNKMSNSQKTGVLRSATTFFAYFTVFNNSLDSFMTAINTETALKDDISARFCVMSEILRRLFEVLPDHFNSESEDIDDITRYIVENNNGANVDAERVNAAYENMKPFFDKEVNIKQIDYMIRSTMQYIYLIMGAAGFTSEGIEKHQPVLKSIFKEGVFSFENIF